MRFSTVFQLPLPQRLAAEAPAPAQATTSEQVKAAPASTPPASELPDDLDERVRLLGEWQLGND